MTLLMGLMRVTKETVSGIHHSVMSVQIRPLRLFIFYNPNRRYRLFSKSDKQSVPHSGEG